MNLVQFSSVSKRYTLGETQITALNGVDFDVRPGDFVAITGPSGSGKTTMLNLIGCLDSPTSGQVCINGETVNSLSESELDRLRSKSFGMIFQNFNLIPVLTALENVSLPLHLHGLKRQQMRHKAQEALAAVGLDRYADFKPDQLSGGQRQRVAVARALVTRPHLILADEPTASLDTVNALALIDLMKQLNAELGVTFVFSTHDDRLLRQVSRIVELRDGHLSVVRETPDRMASTGIFCEAQRVEVM